MILFEFHVLFIVLSQFMFVTVLLLSLYRDVLVSPDMTPKQREARKKLVAELKDRQSHGETGLIIVGSRIVKKTVTPH